MKAIEELIDMNRLHDISLKFRRDLEQLQQEFRNDSECRCADWEIEKYFSFSNNAEISVEFQHLRYTLLKQIMQLLPFKRCEDAVGYFDLSFSTDSGRMSCIFIDWAADLDDEMFDLLYEKCSRYLDSRKNEQEKCAVVEFFADPELNMNWSEQQKDHNSERIKWFSLDYLIKREFGIDNFTGWLGSYLDRL